MVDKFRSYIYNRIVSYRYKLFIWSEIDEYS
ncbi:tRNA(Glu) U13 pseudouridine synthase TruD [Thermoanaerobacterium butyriciformans]|uniref:tRNA(Glu) U13 pseudouridine synthase TruD n=1 Tax=Thermoanaerobacterium butyriciformans TaxID=1702242 RepID=A0ABS4ND83_9THEO|nr:tRNA(Glu) U13 pseudouridine synthase TruD [Thermoanaerobacterium butyriciformans]